MICIFGKEKKKKALWLSQGTRVTRPFKRCQVTIVSGSIGDLPFLTAE
jgi:hypothetical protein